MINLPKPVGSVCSYKNNTSLECAYCHLKGRIRDKCYKLNGYPVDHPYHPNNRGKKHPYNKQSAPQQSVKNGHALEVTVASIPDCSSPDLST